MPRQPDYGQQLATGLLAVAKACQDLGDGHKPSLDRPANREAAELESLLALVDDDGAVVRNPIGLMDLLLGSRRWFVVDGLRAMALLAGRGAEQHLKITKAPAVVARGVLEGLASLAWFAEPGIGGRARAERVVADSAKDNTLRAWTVGPLDGTGIEPLIENDTLIDMCERYGVEYEMGSRLGTPVVNVKSGLQPKAFTLLEGLMPSENVPKLGAVFYHLMSDVAHASTQGLLGRAETGEDQDGRIRVVIDRDEELKQVAPILWAVQIPMMRMADYWGWPTENFNDVMESQTEYVTRITFSGADR